MARTNYLIAGLSGTGKSSVCQELINRGIYAINADAAYGQHIDPDTGREDKQKKQENWVWNQEKLIAELSDKKQEVLFLCGGAMNQEHFYGYFDKVYFLVADNGTLRKRLKARNPNRSSRRNEDLAEQQSWNKEMLAYIKQKGFIAIDATAAVPAVANKIITMSHLNRSHEFTVRV